MPRYQSTKTYGADRGLSCCFRQWRATHSHCSTLHGYSLGFKFVWESESLDSRNWVFDFGGMKPIKQYLDYMFDHTVLVAEDDPAMPFFKSMAEYSTKEEHNGVNENIGYQNPIPHEEGRIAALRIVPGVGCEMTARMVYQESVRILEEMKQGNLGRYDINADVRLVSVECAEHAGNSAVYYGDPADQEPALRINSEAAGVYLSQGDVTFSGVVNNSLRTKDLVDALRGALGSQDPAVLGDLEEFKDVMMELHRIPPVAE